MILYFVPAANLIFLKMDAEIKKVQAIRLS